MKIYLHFTSGYQRVMRWQINLIFVFVLFCIFLQIFKINILLSENNHYLNNDNKMIKWGAVGALQREKELFFFVTTANEA